MSTQSHVYFLRPGPAERKFNRVFGALVSLGFGLRHNYLLQVRGRKSGHMYSTPVNLLEINHQLYLVCPRGRSQWVRNAEANGWVLLKRWRVRKFALRGVPDDKKPTILKEYLERFRITVQRYFPVSPGSSPASFVLYAARYPVFELKPADERS
jgi:deazaflavin-dependent oxidoreductase (nitroreductase family)